MHVNVYEGTQENQRVSKHDFVFDLVMFIFEKYVFIQCPVKNRPGDISAVILNPGNHNIEIINKTRGGIGTGNINRKRERANGGQIQVPDALEVPNTELYIRMDSAIFIV